jgi:tetratricopeptide (TPR) repeat protein
MSNGVTTDRLASLRSRWEADPTSRVFLQLAEEHRHLGQIQEALAVLDRGLREHPGYLSALVAKGRCHLELGEPEPARAVLERVVKQDVTQMVASKLLVRAYLDTGEATLARERLDLYRLLNDSDPEIEVLRRRIQAMDHPSKAPQAAPETPFTALPPDLPSVFPDLATPPSAEDTPVFPELLTPPPPAPTPVYTPLPPAVDAAPTYPDPPRAAVPDPTSVFPDLLTPPPSAALLDGTDIFGLGSFGGTPLPHFAPEPSAPAAEVFPDLDAAAARDRYLSRLGAEGIFPIQAAASLSPPPPAAELPAPPAPSPFLEPEPEAPAPAPLAPLAEDFAPAPSSWREEEPIFAPLPELEVEPLPDFAAPPPALSEHEEPPIPIPVFEEPSPWHAETASFVEVEAELEIEPLAPEIPLSPSFPPPAQPLATSTLAELYLSQGHLEEAERIFHEVLGREPGNPAALAGLDRLRRAERRHRPLEARDLLLDFQPEVAAGPAPRARLRHVLQSYLERLRQRSARDVS